MAEARKSHAALVAEKVGKAFVEFVAASSKWAGAAATTTAPSTGRQSDAERERRGDWLAGVAPSRNYGLSMVLSPDEVVTQIRAK